MITHDSLPADMLDSDQDDALASGAPTLRASTDLLGENQVGLKVQSCTPTSGGSGATAYIWVEAKTYVAGSTKDFWLWWIPGGSQTQPAASAANGSEQVFDNMEYMSLDGGITDETGNYAPINNGSTAGTQFNVGDESREFDGI